MKISVITVCYNAEATIENTIKSLMKQSYNNIEYIIIDGKSTDGTLEILHKYHEYIDSFISEEDSGIYNAMNKGIKAAHGDVIYFLNADDTFIDEFVIEKVAEQFLTFKEVDILYGDVVLSKYGNNYQNVLKKHKHVDKIYFIDNTICHQAVFTRMRVFEKCGMFDETYKLAGDYEWLLKVLLSARVVSRYMNFPVALYSMEGMSASGKESDSVLAYERNEIQRKYFGKWEIGLYQNPLFQWLLKRTMIKPILWKLLEWDL